MAIRLIFTDVFRVAEPHYETTNEGPLLVFDLKEDKVGEKKFTRFYFKLVIEKVNKEKIKIFGYYSYRYSGEGKPHPESSLTISFFTFLIEDAFAAIQENSRLIGDIDNLWLASQIKGALGASMN